MQSLPSPLRSGPCHNRCQVRGIPYRARSHYPPGDPSGIVFFRSLIERVGYFFLRPTIHDLVCRQFVPAAHPHIQGTRLAERKPPRGLIKLHARNSQVGQDPVHPGNPQLVHDLRNLRERRLHQLHCRCKLLQPLRCQHDCLCVLVQADQPSGRQLCRDGCRVAPGSQRCVDVRSIRLYVQPFQHLVKQYRRVWFGPAYHRASPNPSNPGPAHLPRHKFSLIEQAASNTPSVSRAAKRIAPVPVSNCLLGPTFNLTCPTRYTPNDVISSSVSGSVLSLSTIPE